jgi:uncharacterized protein HemX
MEQTNTNSIIPEQKEQQNTQPPMPTEPVSTLADVNPIPEFQNIPSKNKNNKILPIVAISIGVIILLATGLYYWMTSQNVEVVEENTVEVVQTVTPTPTPTPTPMPTSNDRMILEIDQKIVESDSENIESTSQDLEDLDFENVDLELQQNPGL